MRPVKGRPRLRLKRSRSRRACLGAVSAVVAAAAVTAVMGQAWVIAKVSFYMGEVGFRKADSQDWTGIALQQPLFTGDAVRTGVESRLEVKMGDEGILVRIDENAQLEISTRSLQEWKGPGTKAALRSGRLWSNVRRLAADRENLTIETPTVLAAVRGTVFRIDIPDSLTTMLRVYQGAVEVRDNPAPPGGGMREVGPPREVAPPREVTAQQWLELVTANQQLIFTRGERPEVSEFDPNEDARLDWVQWNRKRDEELVPPENPPPEVSPADPAQDQPTGLEVDLLYVGQEAPLFGMRKLGTTDFVFLRDFAGELRTEARMRGDTQKAIVMSFFASWCKPCPNELAVLTQISKEYEDRDIVFLLINFGETDGVAAAWLEKHPEIEGTVLMDPFLNTSKKYGAAVLPRTVIIDKNRIVRFIEQGFVEEHYREGVTSAIESVLTPGG